MVNILLDILNVDGKDQKINHLKDGYFEMYKNTGELKYGSFYGLYDGSIEDNSRSSFNFYLGRIENYSDLINELKSFDYNSIIDDNLRIEEYVKIIYKLKIEVNKDFSNQDKYLIDRFKYIRGLELINEYSKTQGNNFIFPFYDKSFLDINFGEQRLPYNLYIKSDSITSYYNKLLKELQLKVFGENFRLGLSSHIPRYTYTNIKINEQTDLYDLSISLGHRSLITTQKYINNPINRNRVIRSNEFNGKKLYK